jgi:hypothetical protein
MVGLAFKGFLNLNTLSTSEFPRYGIKNIQMVRPYVENDAEENLCGH